MKAVPPDAELGLPGVWNRVGHGGLIHLVEEGRLEEGHQGHLRHQATKGPHGSDVGRVVGRGQEGEILHRRKDVVVHDAGPAQGAAMDRLEADAAQVP